MNCPLCNLELRITDRSGIEIDYCPKCRGVWLDRGELDKIIERSAAAPPAEPETPRRGTAQAGYPAGNPVYPASPPPAYHQAPLHTRDHGAQYGHDGYAHGYGHHKRKRKSLLEEIFDFD